MHNDFFPYHWHLLPFARTSTGLSPGGADGTLSAGTLSAKGVRKSGPFCIICNNSPSGLQSLWPLLIGRVISGVRRVDGPLLVVTIHGDRPPAFLLLLWGRMEDDGQV
jgi:hypothetical protein